jgi:N-acetylmuramoyl-L-alanine amidase
VNLYDGDPEQPGVFVDRHEPGYRIMMLRRPRIPSVIIETHHALDFEEVERWKEPRTLEAFSAAVAQGLVDGLTSP